MNGVNQTLHAHADYRAFLRSAYEAGAGKVSLAGWGKRLGMSKMAVKYLIDGQRHLADGRVDHVARAVGLSGPDARYFRALVGFGKAKTDGERGRWFQAMVAIREAPLRESLLGSAEMALVSHWSLPAILEMSYMRGFRADAAWIRPRLKFKLSHAQVASALATVTALGLLKGGARAGDRLSVPDGIRSHLYRRFAASLIEMAAGAVRDQDAADREVFNLTISVSEARFHVAKRRIEAFRHELHALLAGDEEAARVVQISMQMFTLAAGAEGDRCEA